VSSKDRPAAWIQKFFEYMVLYTGKKRFHGKTEHHPVDDDYVEMVIRIFICMKAVSSNIRGERKKEGKEK
jgi:hypothetical protein